MGKTSIFPRFFIGLGMPQLIPKMDVFQVFGWKLRCFAKISIVTKNRDGALVALVVAGSKYEENINFSKVFHKFGHAPTDPKNVCFPVIWLEIQCFARLFPLIEW